MINTSGMTFLPAFTKFRLLIQSLLGLTQQKEVKSFYVQEPVTFSAECHIVDTKEQLHNPSAVVWELR
jgi:hypothetical protein